MLSRALPLALVMLLLTGCLAGPSTDAPQATNSTATRPFDPEPAGPPASLLSAAREAAEAWSTDLRLATVTRGESAEFTYMRGGPLEGDPLAPGAWTFFFADDLRGEGIFVDVGLDGEVLGKRASNNAASSGNVAAFGPPTVPPEPSVRHLDADRALAVVRAHAEHGAAYLSARAIEMQLSEDVGRFFAWYVWVWGEGAPLVVTVDAEKWQVVSAERIERVEAEPASPPTPSSSSSSEGGPTASPPPAAPRIAGVFADRAANGTGYDRVLVHVEVPANGSASPATQWWIRERDPSGLRTLPPEELALEWIAGDGTDGVADPGERVVVAFTLERPLVAHEEIVVSLLRDAIVRAIATVRVPSGSEDRVVLYEA